MAIQLLSRWLEKMHGRRKPLMLFDRGGIAGARVGLGKLVTSFSLTC
jgi:hypothetical protein